jgi:phage shock protein A
MNKLDEAKINLKNTLERLDSVVAKRLQHANSNSTAAEVARRIQLLEQEIINLKSTLDDKNDEMNYLREQNSELQAKVGEAQHQNFVLESKNREAAEKFENVINKMKSYLLEKGVI